MKPEKNKATLSPNLSSPKPIYTGKKKCGCLEKDARDCADEQRRSGLQVSAHDVLTSECACCCHDKASEALEGRT